MEKTNETRSGVSVNFLAMIAWLSVIGAEWVPFLVAGAILFLEKDAWLKKQMIKVLTLTAITRIFNIILFSHILNVIFPRGTSLFMAILEICVFLAEDVLWIVFAARAWKRTPAHTSLDHFAGVCIGEAPIEPVAVNVPVTPQAVVPQTATPQAVASSPEASAKLCPSCGKPISEDMIFCISCGTKVR